MEVLYNGLELTSHNSYYRLGSNGLICNEQVPLTKLEVEKAILLIKIINNTINYLNQNYTVNLSELQSGSVVKLLKVLATCFGFDRTSGELVETIGSPYLLTGINLVRIRSINPESTYSDKRYYFCGINLGTNKKEYGFQHLLGFYDYSLKKLKAIEEITRSCYLGDNYTHKLIRNYIVTNLGIKSELRSPYYDIMRAISDYRIIQ